MKTAIADWETTPPHNSAELEMIAPFVARGMKRVYCRSDTFSRHKTYNMDIWKNSVNRLFVRFWSRNKMVDIDWESYEIKNFDVSVIPVSKEKSFSEEWVPEVVRIAYDEWIAT